MSPAHIFHAFSYIFILVKHVVNRDRSQASFPLLNMDEPRKKWDEIDGRCDIKRDFNIERVGDDEKDASSGGHTMCEDYFI